MVSLHQGLYSLNGKTSYRQISWSLEAARLGVIMIVSLWNLTGISAALLPRCLLNFRAIGKVQTRISRLRDFTRSCGKTSYRLVNRGPVWKLGHGREVTSQSFSLSQLWLFRISERKALRVFVRNVNMYLQMISVLYTDMSQVIEFLPHVRQVPTYFTYSISLLLIPW